MEKIQHRMFKVNGINMHVAEIGEGPVVLFIHGFPDLWYSWRHQMLFLSSHGYRAVAPDLRGFGDTDAPPSASSYTSLHIIGDLVALLDELGVDKVFLVGHDWGAFHAWSFCLYRPERVKALVNLSVSYMCRTSLGSPLSLTRAAFGDDFYVCRFQKVGEAEEEFARFDTERLMKWWLSLNDPVPLCVPKEVGFGGSPDSYVPSPPWLSDYDLKYYADTFRRTGFSGGLNYYRAIDLNWELTAAWTNAQVNVPTKFLVGDRDLTTAMLGIDEYIKSGGFKREVPLLEDVVVMEGVGHFIHQERPDETNSHILDFIKKF